MVWVLLAHVLGLLHYLSKRSALKQHLVLRARQKIVMQTIREETARRFSPPLHPSPPLSTPLHPSTAPFRLPSSPSPFSAEETA